MVRADNQEEEPCSLQSFIDLRRGGERMALSRVVTTVNTSCYDG